MFNIIININIFIIINIIINKFEKNIITIKKNDNMVTIRFDMATP
jgi:hypothetical protein